MVFEDLSDICLVSQQIRELIDDGGIITNSFDESRIQPSSYETIVEDEIFIVDTETSGLFRPNSKESVYKTLLQLPSRQRQRVNIDDGFELKKGFSYLIHLEDKVKLNGGMYLKSSPKSSSGRLFLNTRLLMDYNSCFDEGSNFYLPNKELDLWLLVQPLAFNIIIHPGLTLNQLRFLKGNGAQLAPLDLIKELQKYPTIYSKDENGLLNPIEPIITDGLQIHLNFSGEHSKGIVGLRARHNPTPIDISKKEGFEAEDYFEPVKKNKKIERGHYLLSSAEILKIPSHLNAELRKHSSVGFSGPLHFAGFIDNGFIGDLVFEVRPEELSGIELSNGMPISKLDIFRTKVPDKIYGKKSGSHYQGQVGPKPPKHFKSFNYSYAAKHYEQLNRLILVQDANILNIHRKNEEGFEFLSQNEADELYKDVNNGFFQSRYDCESDGLILQPIPYVILFGPEETIFSYVRAEKIEDYGDPRLFGKHSLGLGGHIIKEDAPHYIERCLQREVMEEEVDILGKYSKPTLIGTLMASDKPVDKVHFGLIFASHVEGDINVKESSIISGGMVPLRDLIEKKSSAYETWSKVLIPYLNEIHGMSY